MRILLIEDDPQIGDGLHHGLSKHGFTVDWFQNGKHGKDALSLDGRIRNINKNVLWAKLGLQMKSTWIPLNNHIRENLEDSYVAADIIILNDLLEPQSSLDFVTSSLHKFSKLQEVFYV